MKKEKKMKRLLAVFGLLLGFIAIGHAGTPQENGQVPFQSAPFSGATILTSSATSIIASGLTLNVSTPSVINSGGQAINGRNCFTKFVLQIATYSVVTVADNNTTVMTIYGSGIGTTGINTLTLSEDHLGPLCTAAGDRTVFTLTNNGAPALAGNSQVINVEGYTTYGGTNNSGPMY